MESSTLKSIMTKTIALYNKYKVIYHHINMDNISRIVSNLLLYRQFTVNLHFYSTIYPVCVSFEADRRYYLQVCGYMLENSQ